MTDRHDYLSVLFDHYPTGVLVADDEARYVDANRAALELLGRTRDEVVGHHLHEVVLPGRHADTDGQWRSFLRDGTQQGIFTIALPDGSSRDVHFTAHANFVPGLHCSFLSEAARSPERDPSGDTLTVCAWTKRVFFKGEWLTIEEYLLVAHGKFVRHSMSPGAFRLSLEQHRP